jgi:hypothetical protein
MLGSLTYLGLSAARIHLKTSQDLSKYLLLKQTGRVIVTTKSLMYLIWGEGESNRGVLIGSEGVSDWAKLIASGYVRGLF